VTGWKLDQRVPSDIKKCVIAVGPHTSNWDFVLGRMAFMLYGVQGRYLVKKELFFPPLGWFLKAIGCIPVDRKKRNNLTDTALKYFEENETMFIVFSPKEPEVTIQTGKKDFTMLHKKQESRFTFATSISKQKQVDSTSCSIQPVMSMRILSTLKVC